MEPLSYFDSSVPGSGHWLRVSLSFTGSVLVRRLLSLLYAFIPKIEREPIWYS